MSHPVWGPNTTWSSPRTWFDSISSYMILSINTISRSSSSLSIVSVFLFIVLKTLRISRCEHSWISCLIIKSTTWMQTITHSTTRRSSWESLMWSIRHLPKYSYWARLKLHRKRRHCFLIYSITLYQYISQDRKSFSYQCMGWMEVIPRLMQIEIISSLWLQVQGVNRVSPASWATPHTMSQPRQVRSRP